MLSSRHGFPAAALLTACVLAFLAAVALAAATSDRVSGQTQTPPARAVPESPAQPTSQAGGFAGDDTCTTCHEAQGKQLHQTLHGQAQNSRTPAAKDGRTCETCHGPGQAHAEAGGDKTKILFPPAMAPREAAELCVTCHNRATHANWKGGMHDARNLSCVTCHSVHSPKSERAQLKTATVIETCAACHKTEVAKLQRSGHMPVREGKMDCASCHNPHGSTSVRMLKVGNWVNETCVSCHTEKRGPYLWDHAPVREACNNCHDPHGSNNERMLVAKLPMLCQRCHIGTRHPSTIYDSNQLAAKSVRLIGRGCVNCHAQIHGSNSPAGHTFVR
jgi:DmsE family decaheme c-type cytochrome